MTFRPPLPDGYELQYLRDDDADTDLDRELRELLCLGFPGENGQVETSAFFHKRYHNEMPRHRWLVRETSGGILVAHFAVHEKVFDIEGEEIIVGAVGEVCVNPDHRGQHLVVVMANGALPVMRERTAHLNDRHTGTELLIGGRNIAQNFVASFGVRFVVNFIDSRTKKEYKSRFIPRRSRLPATYFSRQGAVLQSCFFEKARD